MKLDVQVHHYFHNVHADTETSRSLQALVQQGARIMATLHELKDQLTGVGEKLTEASTELTAKIAELIAALDTVPADVQLKADELTGMAKSLADIVPNATEPTP